MTPSRCHGADPGEDRQWWGVPDNPEHLPDILCLPAHDILLKMVEESRSPTRPQTCKNSKYCEHSSFLNKCIISGCCLIVKFFQCISSKYCSRSPMVYTIWPASHEKGPSDITNSVDQDQPLQDVENSYT